jgi:hypothetical protein
MKQSHLLVDFSWKHAVGEFVLIVTGVLVAMAANSWWESRRDRTREETYVIQLLADTRANQVRVDSAIAADSVAQRSTGRLLGTLSGNVPPATRDSTPRGIQGADAFSSPDFRPLLGTYTALLETGDLQLLDSPDLRFRLVAYQSSLESVRETVRHTAETLERYEDGYFRAVLPLLVGGGSGRGFRRLSDVAQGRQEVLIPLGAANATRGRRMRVLRSLRKETALLVEELEAERRRMAE